MYCNKCGKQIDYDAILCDECLGRSIRTAEPVPHPVSGEVFCGRPNVQSLPSCPEYVGTVPDASFSEAKGKTESPTKENDKMYRFGKALTSAIFSYVSFMMLALFASVGDVDSLAVGTVFGLGFSIPGMVVGIVTLVKVVRYKKKNDLLPIAPFVLSIFGTALGGLILFISFVTLTAF